MARVAVDFWLGQGAREAAGSAAILPERSDTAQAKKRRDPTGERGWDRLPELLVGHGVDGTRSLLAPPPSSPIDARAGHVSISTGSYAGWLGSSSAARTARMKVPASKGFRSSETRPTGPAGGQRRGNTGESGGRQRVLIRPRPGNQKGRVRRPLVLNLQQAAGGHAANERRRGLAHAASAANGQRYIFPNRRGVDPKLSA